MKKQVVTLTSLIDSSKKAEQLILGQTTRLVCIKQQRKLLSDVNKWNINYGDLTPFERNVMKRGMPFYTWTRKAMPLMIESPATRPGRVLRNYPTKQRHLRSRRRRSLTTLDPHPQWLKDVGFARLTDEAEPNVWSVPLPSQDLGKWFGGGTIDSIFKMYVVLSTPLLKRQLKE